MKKLSLNHWLTLLLIALFLLLFHACTKELDLEAEGVTVHATVGDYRLTFTSDRVVYDRSKHDEPPHFTIDAKLSYTNSVPTTISFDENWWTAEVLTGAAVLGLDQLADEAQSAKKTALLIKNNSLKDTYQSPTDYALNGLEPGFCQIRMSARFLPEGAEEEITVSFDLPFIVI